MFLSKKRIQYFCRLVFDRALARGRLEFYTLGIVFLCVLVFRKIRIER